MIGDLGLSKKLGEDKSNSALLGMPAYIDPQCYIKSNYKRNEKSDIYSLGVLLWEISSGKSPFSDTTTSRYKIITDVVNKRRETPVKNTPLEYQQLYENCWEEEPDKRPKIDEIHGVLNILELQFANNERTGARLSKNFSDQRNDNSSSSTASLYDDSIISLPSEINQNGKVINITKKIFLFEQRYACNLFIDIILI